MSEHTHDWAESCVYNDKSLATQIGMTNPAAVEVCRACEAYRLDGRVYVPESFLVEAEAEGANWKRRARWHNEVRQAAKARAESLATENATLRGLVVEARGSATVRLILGKDWLARAAAHTKEGD